MASIEAEKGSRSFVHHFVCRFGTPSILHTDRGRNFYSALVKAMRKLLGIRKVRTTAYHPQSDGLVERFNRTWLNLLSIAARDNTFNWDSYLPLLMFAYCTFVKNQLGVHHFSLFLGGKRGYPLIFCLACPTLSIYGAKQVCRGPQAALGHGIQAGQKVRGVATVKAKSAL